MTTTYRSHTHACHTRCKKPSSRLWENNWTFASNVFSRQLWRLVKLLISECASLSLQSDVEHVADVWKHWYKAIIWLHLRIRTLRKTSKESFLLYYIFFYYVSKYWMRFVLIGLCFAMSVNLCKTITTGAIHLTLLKKHIFSKYYIELRYKPYYWKISLYVLWVCFCWHQSINYIQSNNYTIQP